MTYRLLFILAGCVFLCIPAFAVKAEDTTPDRKHRIEIGHGVPVCVWGPNFVSACGIGGNDFHGGYVYSFNKRFGIGGFVNAGVVIALDLGITWRTWILPKLLYCDIKAAAMAPRGVSIDHVWFYGFETALGLSAPARGRARFIMEADVLFLFNQMGYLGFLRHMVGLVVTL